MDFPFAHFLGHDVVFSFHVFAPSEIKKSIKIREITPRVALFFRLKDRVSDPSHFDVHPDLDLIPWIHIWEKWTRILGSTFGKSGPGS